MELPVAIVGAGLAGLNCARRLQELEIPFVIYEAADAVGGRVRTDIVDGFRLDRGFQVFLPSYPEAKRVLDYESLDLKPFVRGALIRYRGAFHRIADPRSELLSVLSAAFGPIGTIRDKFRLPLFAREMSRGEPADDETATDQPTLDLLRWVGQFSDELIVQFFRPFFGGVFLEGDLRTSARFFRFVFRHFLAEAATVPALGMQDIPDQLAYRLPEGSIRLKETVERVEPGFVELFGNRRISARAIVVATEGNAAHRLLGERVPPVMMNGTITLSYDAAESPVREPILVLDGEGRGPVNNLVVMSECSSQYAPAGHALVSASIVGVPNASDEEIDRKAREQLRDWYGMSVDGWRLLRVQRIPEALPDMSVGILNPWQRPVRLHPGLYVCGDHRDQGSINGALESGFRAAQAVAEDLNLRRL
jgi:protoporphyrinogen oxidase